MPRNGCCIRPTHGTSYTQQPIYSWRGKGLSSRLLPCCWCGMWIPARICAVFLRKPKWKAIRSASETTALLQFMTPIIHVPPFRKVRCKDDPAVVTLLQPGLKKVRVVLFATSRFIGTTVFAAPARRPRCQVLGHASLPSCCAQAMRS